MAKVGLYGGGFKPPTKGHFEVVQKILDEYPDLDILMVLVGKGIRNSISQDESMLIWDIYQRYLPFKIKITPVSSPIGEIYSLAKGNLEDEFIWFLGERQGKEEDVKDIEIRTKHLTNKKENYPNLTTAVISTKDTNISGTQARKYLKNQDKTGFFSLLPDSLSNGEKDEVYNILSPSIEEGRKKKRDPKKGTGKKPEGSGRRLYTDEDPKDTVGIKFRTKEDIVDTLNKKSFKAKSHARQSQIINLIHQRVRAAYQNTKDPDTKSRLKRGLDYIENKKEASKEKTQRLRKQNESKKGGGRGNVGARYRAVEKRGNKFYYIQDDPLGAGVRQEFGPFKTKQAALNKMGEFAPSLNYRDLTEKNNLTPENIDPKSQEKHKGKSSPYGSAYELVDEGDTYEKMAAKGKKAGNLKQGTVRKRLGIKKGEKVPLSLIKKEITRLKKMDKDPDKKGAQLGDKNQKYYKALQLAKTLKTTTNVNENATYSNNIDYKQQIFDLTKHMLKKGENITPLPKVILKHGDMENAKEFLGKTAYYDPNTMSIVLYTEGRHPKDIVRSYAHEMIHHIQHLEDRLGDITGTDTTSDGHLDKIEQEANLRGTMTFRNWTDSILNEAIVGEKIKCDKCDWNWNIVDGGDDLFVCHKCGHDNELISENKNKDPFGITAYAYELARGLEEQKEKIETKYTIYSDMDGVLTDFEGRFKEFSKGIAPRDYENKFGRKKFWNLVDEVGGLDFWANMKWMSDGKEYWSYIQKYNPIILTAPSLKPVSRLGKRQWRDGNLPGVKMKMASARNKPNYSKRNAILIDDRQDTIDAWSAIGGIGIHHTSAANTIKKLKELGL